MPLSSIFTLGVFAVAFFVLYSAARPRPGVADRDLRHTPLSFATMLGCLLWNVFRETSSPTGNIYDRWVGYIFSAVIAGYLIRMYARLHARLRQQTPPDLDHPA